MTVGIPELRSRIGGAVLVAGDPEYEPSLQRWARNAEMRAAVVVLVTSAADVAAAVFPRRTWSNCSFTMQG